jgi:hypothetical protein
MFQNAMSDEGMFERDSALHVKATVIDRPRDREEALVM